MSRPPKALVVLTKAPEEEPSDGAAVLRQLEPVANRPLLAHVLDQIGAAGVREVGLVVGRRAAEQVRCLVEDGSAWGLEAHYLAQDEPLGTGDAIMAADGFLAGSRFLLHHGDCVVDADLGAVLRRAAAERLDALVVARGGRADDGRAGPPHGRLDGRAALPLRLLVQAAAVPAMVLGPRVLEALGRLAPSWRGQRELADALDGMLQSDGAIELRTVGGWRFGGSIDDLLACNRILLDTLVTTYRDGRAGDARIDGRVVIARSARIEGSVVRGPSIIGPGAQVIDSYVGPYSSIGAGALIEGVEVEDLIVGERAVLARLDRRLASSMIGPGARLSRDFGLSGGLRVSLGARAEIVWS